MQGLWEEQASYTEPPDKVAEYAVKRWAGRITRRTDQLLKKKKILFENWNSIAHDDVCDEEQAKTTRCRRLTSSWQYSKVEEEPVPLSVWGSS